MDRTSKRRRTHVWTYGAALLWMAGAAAAVFAEGEDVVYLKQPLFKIPVQVASDKLGQIKELRLFVSTDQGQTWDLVKSAEPTQQSFTFRAQGDGEYWFTLAYVDQAGVVEPPDVRREPPGLKVVLDTRSPMLELKALPREEGKVGVSWRLRDEKLDLSSFKVEMKGEREGVWQEVPAARMRDGEGSWPAATGDAYSIRASVRDRAGNESVARVEFPGRSAAPHLASDERNLPGAGANGGFSVPPAPSTTSIPRAPVRNPSTTPAPATAATSSGPAPSPSYAAPPPPTMTYSPPPAPSYASAAPQYHEAQRPVFDRSRPDLPADPPSSGIQTVGLSEAPPARGAIASTTSPPPAAANRAAAEPAPSPRTPWLVASKSFAVDYEIKNSGPAGVKKVEMYITRDNGKTWQLLGEDADRTPPFDVTLPEEGRYGLRVVVMSPAGWQQAPKPGEVPRIQVEVDTTPPEAELYQLIPDPASATDSLLIRWSAKDAHLAAQPVNLYFAERPEGPWWAVKTGLPPAGQYSWKVPQGVPPEVYLRLEARDQAGNVSRANTPEPVSVDLSRPVAEVIAILPSGTMTR